MAEKITGPKSYFPSIEKKYGQPIAYWMKQLGDGGTWVRFAQYGEMPADQATMAQAGMESYFDSLGAYLAR